MRFTDDITLNFNNNMSTAAVFLDIEKAFDTKWHNGLLYKLRKLKFPLYLLKHIKSYLTHKQFRVSVEGEMSTPREMQTGVPQGSVLAPILYNLDIIDIPRTPGVHLALFADDTCIYTTDGNKNYVIRKFQRGLNTMEEWYEQWNIKRNEDKTRAVYFSIRLRRGEACLNLKGQIIEFVNIVKYLGVTVDKRMTWKAHIDWSITKALQTLGQIYPLLKSEKLGTKTKLTSYKH
jgi:hypothetical protein